MSPIERVFAMVDEIMELKEKKGVLGETIQHMKETWFDPLQHEEECNKIVDEVIAAKNKEIEAVEASYKHDLTKVMDHYIIINNKLERKIKRLENKLAKVTK